MIKIMIRINNYWCRIQVDNFIYLKIINYKNKYIQYIFEIKNISFYDLILGILLYQRLEIIKIIMNYIAR